jgi:hypothetical protein
VHIELTSGMEQSTYWEADSRPARQEILRFLWKRKVYFRIHKSQQLDPVISQFNLSPYTIFLYESL